MKVQYNGKMIEGEKIDFSPMSEPWAEYHLADGNILRYRSTITRVIKTGEKTDDGQDLYIVQSSNTVVLEERQE